MLRDKETLSNIRKYRTSNPLARTVTEGFVRRIQGITRSLNPGSVLDAGCGEGSVLSGLEGKMVVGLDISRLGMKESREKSKKRLVLGSVYELPFKPNSFELAVNTEVLEHLEDPGKAIEELKRVAGVCLISVPNEPHFSAMNLLRLKYLKRLGNPPGHIHKWGMKSFSGLLRKHFGSMEMTKSFPWIIAVCRVRSPAGQASPSRTLPARRMT